MRTCRRADDGVSLDRDGEVECRPLPGLGLDPDPAMISVNDPLTNREPDAGAGIFIAGVEAFEKSKDILLKFRCDAYPVIGHSEVPLQFLPLRADVDFGDSVRTPVLDRVTNEILKELL